MNEKIYLMEMQHRTERHESGLEARERAEHGRGNRTH